MFRDLSHAFCRVFISRLSALETCFPDLVLPAWPASEHTSAAQHYDAQLPLVLRPSAAGATVARDTATPLLSTRRGQSPPPPSPACTTATPWPSPGPGVAWAQAVPDASWHGA